MPRMCWLVEGEKLVSMEASLTMTRLAPESMMKARLSVSHRKQQGRESVGIGVGRAPSVWVECGVESPSGGGGVGVGGTLCMSGALEVEARRAVCSIDSWREGCLECPGMKTWALPGMAYVSWGQRTERKNRQDMRRYHEEE